jgi:hypothetical protein
LAAVLALNWRASLSSLFSRVNALSDEQVHLANVILVDWTEDSVLLLDAVDALTQRFVDTHVAARVRA